MFIREFSFLLLIAAQTLTTACLAVLVWLISAGGLDEFAQSHSDPGWLQIIMVRIGAGFVLSALVAWLTWRFTFLAGQLLKAGTAASARRIAAFCGGLTAIASAAGTVQFSLARAFY